MMIKVKPLIKSAYMTIITKESNSLYDN